MNHVNIKTYSEFALNEGKFFDYLATKYDSIKRWVKGWINRLVGSVREGAERAELYLKENPQFLEQIIASINNLPSSDKSSLLSLKSSIDSFTGSEYEVKQLMGSDVVESNESRINYILKKIGEWTGTGLLLLTTFGGAFTAIYGMATNMPPMAIIGLILFFIGIGINSMTSDNY